MEKCGKSGQKVITCLQMTIGEGRRGAAFRRTGKSKRCWNEGKVKDVQRDCVINDNKKRAKRTKKQKKSRGRCNLFAFYSQIFRIYFAFYSHLFRTLYGRM